MPITFIVRFLEAPEVDRSADALLTCCGSDATFYPSLTKNVIFTGWAEMQDPGSVAQGQGQGGMIQEVLASMGAGGTIKTVCRSLHDSSRASPR